MGHMRHMRHKRVQLHAPQLGKLFIARVKSLLVFFALRTCNAAPVLQRVYPRCLCGKIAVTVLAAHVSHVSHLSHETKY